MVVFGYPAVAILKYIELYDLSVTDLLIKSD